MANVDYTRALQDYKNSQILGQRSLKRYRNAGPGTALATALSGYFAGQGMNQAQGRMGDADKAEKDTRALDYHRIAGAMAGNTPYNQTEAETFPGEQPIAGLTDKGPNFNPLLDSMLSSQTQGIPELALGKMMGANNQQGTATMQDYAFINTLPKEEQERFMALKRAPGAKVIRRGDVATVIDGNGAVLDEFTIATDPNKDPGFMGAGAQAQAEAKGKVERWNTQMSEGLQAADGIPILTRSLDLLREGVKTGGWDNIKLKASNFFGVTGADEAELSANLGRAVLSQLRATFGAAFTEREGDRLAFIEANFGKSTKANVRLLEQLELMARREAKRGIKAAKAAGDDDMAQQIQDALDFKLGAETQANQSLMADPTPEQYKSLPIGTKYIYEGDEYTKGQ